MGMQALGAAFDALGDSPLATSERRAALFDALVPDEEPPAAAAAGGEGADAAAPPRAAVSPSLLLAAARWQLGAYPTSLAEDEATLREVTAADGPVDPRIVAVLEYRLARKRLLRFVEELLATFLGE